MTEEKLIAGQLSLKESLAELYPWMSDYQIESLVPILLENLAKHIREGGKPGIFYPATDREPARIVLLDAVPETNNASEIESLEEAGK